MSTSSLTLHSLLSDNAIYNANYATMPIMYQLHIWHCATCTNGIVCTIGIVCINGIVWRTHMALSAYLALSECTSGIVMLELALDVA